jgi:hypothetical protein
VRAEKHVVESLGPEGIWLGGYCEGPRGECHRDEQTKKWQWVGEGEISYDLKYWANYPGADAQPRGFDEPGCLYMLPGPKLYASDCGKKLNFLCEYSGVFSQTYEQL